MASLRTLINNKASNIVAESNIEQGEVFFFSPGFQNTTGNFCWISPRSGTAIIEVWGASGSGALMCCCGGGLPGNPGAYARKTITVLANCTVCGSIGMSCGNTGALNYRGRSEATQICWVGSGTNGCICAEGGIGGYAYCSTGSSLYCCYTSGSFCSEFINTQCGIVCNYGPGVSAGCCAQAYGGDVNCFGGFSCASFFGCSPSCTCQYNYHVALSPGIVGTDGAVITFGVDSDTGVARNSGQGYHSFAFALSAASRSPTMGVPFTTCWGFAGGCGCYDVQGCQTLMPVGVPGLPPNPCSSVRDHGIRGGNGAVRIQLIG